MNVDSSKPQRFLAKTTLYLLIAIILIRLICIWLMGPMPQDAYYYFYSQHPDLSYFDHPPAIAYLLRLFTSVFGKHVFAIKLADSMLTIGTTFAIYQLARKILPQYESNKVIILFLSTLMVSILSLVSTPDTPLLFFWTLSLIFLHEAVFNEKKWFWLFAGIAMGLAFDSKYTGVFLPAGMILFLLLSKSKRKYLYSIWPWLSCVIMILVSSPVIIWNVNNHFASFAFQGSQRMHDAAAFELKPRLIFGLIGHQLALLIPIGLITLIYAVIRLLKNHSTKWGELSVSHLFLLSFFLPIFLVFLLLSPIYWIKINWMMPAYITGLILAGSIISEKWLRIQLVVSFIIHIGLFVEIVFYPFQVRSDDTWVGWEELTDKTELAAKQQGADFIFSADSYKTAAELNLYADQFVYGQNIIGERALQFDFIGTNLSLLEGKSAIFVDSDPGFTDELKQVTPTPTIIPFFKSITQLNPIIIKIDGRAVRKFYVYLCKGYRRPETGDRRPETGDRRPKTEDRRPKTEDRRPKTFEFGHTSYEK